MRALIVSLLLLAGSAHADPVLRSYILTLSSSDGQEAHLSPSQIDEKMSDPRTPSCLVFAQRRQSFLKQEAEIDFLVKHLNGSASAARELSQLMARQQDLSRELKSQTYEVRVRYDLPAEDKALAWIKARQYRLKVLAPSLTWAGFDASEPEGIQIVSDDLGFSITNREGLSDYCAKPLSFEVRLEEL